MDQKSYHNIFKQNVDIRCILIIVDPITVAVAALQRSGLQQSVCER